MKQDRVLISILILGLAVVLVLQVTGYQVLYWQSTIPSGHSQAPRPGELTRLPSRGEALRCHYFTGRTHVSDVFSKAGPDGIDECPLLVRTRRPSG